MSYTLCVCFSPFSCLLAGLAAHLSWCMQSPLPPSLRNHWPLPLPDTVSAVAAVQQFKHFKQYTYLLNVNISITEKSMVQRPECAQCLCQLLLIVSFSLNSWSLAETVKSQTRKPKCSKGYHCSRNAYMLVYKVQEEESSDPSRAIVEVPCK